MLFEVNGPEPLAKSWSLTRQRAGALLVAVIVTIGLAAGGVTREAEHAIRNVFFALRGHEASGQLHIVEMDAASVAAIGRWPWPRRHYASVIDQLHSAGAASITLDVDFSSTSDLVEDTILAASVAEAGGKVALPTFKQMAAHGSDRSLDALPISPLRDSVTLASVSVNPDSDGLVRNMLLGSMTAGVPRPSLSALIANRGGVADGQFPIDFAIDPASIPRHSFVAVARGRFDPEEFRGKDVLIGATAIEMGDRYVVPRYGVLPGVVVQALATETLYRGVPRHSGWPSSLLMAAALALWIAGARTLNSAAARAFIALATLGAALIACWIAALVLLQLAPAVVLVGTTTIVRAVTLLGQRRHAERMRDSETGLPNRLAFNAKGAQAPGALAVVALIDGYDRLTTVLGSAGSTFLIQRIAERVRVGSGTGEIFRIEDRSLAWMLDAEHYEVEEMLAGMAAVMRSPIEIEGRRVDITLHFGVAHAAQLSEATLAAGEALREGQQWRYHAAAERAALEREVSLMGELDAALSAGELEVLYQPKLELKSNRITSVEALVRWHHPQRGHLRPDMFIPLAEESDRIADLTLFVLTHAIEDLRHWRTRGLVVKAAVNISARLVDSPSFAAAVEALLKGSSVLSQQLIFEVTESATIADRSAAAAALRRFRSLGIAISLDDYGTGRSTLSYLKQLPLSELKIDRSFVQFVHRDASDAALVRSTIALAHELGLTVVAEGVEEPDCLTFLREVGCDFAQGYLIGKAVTASDLLALAAGELSVAA